MFYITGDMHGDFRRLSRKSLLRKEHDLTEGDYVIVCGDFCLLWEKDRTLDYNLKFLSQLPFTVLWVQGNHENYNMIEEYPLSKWNGGNVRHIIQDKVILLERGQVFNIEGTRFFTFGGASSHDVEGGIFDQQDPAYDVKRKRAVRRRLPYRVLNKSWWSQELPTEEEMEEGLKNLEQVGYSVDYVITHCASTSIQSKVEKEKKKRYRGFYPYKKDILTEYFEMLEKKMSYKCWFFGHYHENFKVDKKHFLLYEDVEKII